MSVALHKTVVCSCGRVIFNCRCAGPKPTETRPHPSCGKPALLEPADAAQMQHVVDSGLGAKHVAAQPPAEHVRRPECALLGCLACEQRESELRARLEQLVRDCARWYGIDEDAARALLRAALSK